MRLRGKGRNRTSTLQERAGTAFKYCTDVSMTVGSFATEYVTETVVSGRDNFRKL